MKTVTLIVGDWSDDGHGKTASIVVQHDLPSNKKLQEAYRQGCLLLDYEANGFYREGNEYKRGIHKCEDIMYEVVAKSYEDSTIPADIAEKLIEAGILPNSVDADFYYKEDYDENYYIEGPEGFARIWLEIAKLADPDLEYEIIYEDTINIGGYGLFTA